MLKKTRQNKYFQNFLFDNFSLVCSWPYHLIKYESVSQLLWFCNIVLILLAFGLYFESSIVLTAVLLGALAAQLPWMLNFLIKLFFGHYLFGVSSYMFGYGFHSIRFYAELDHLLILPLSMYGVYKLHFHKTELLCWLTV